jgi:hypothetical protein
LMIRAIEDIPGFEAGQCRRGFGQEAIDDDAIVILEILLLALPVRHGSDLRPEVSLAGKNI